MINVAEQWTFPSERPLIDALSARHRLVHFDASGFGLSEPSPEPFQIDTLIDDILTVADAAGIDRFAFLSESGASLAAVRLAARHPDRITKMALVGGYVDGRARRGPATSPDPIRGLIEEGWTTGGGGLALAYQLSYFPEGPMDMLKAMVEREQTTASEAQMLRLRDVVNTDSIADILPRVQCPTLIVQGRSNAVHPLSEAQKLAAGIPKAELVVLDTANHVPLPGNAVWADYLDILLDFLAP
nr:alpha/beta fold hydrolase [Thalassococcus arenae]